MINPFLISNAHTRLDANLLANPRARNHVANSLNKHHTSTKSKMYLQLLAFWHNISIQISIVWNVGKQMLRDALGPAPISYYLLQDGRVLPTTIILPQTILTTSYVFDPHSSRLMLYGSDPAQRYRRLPTIAANFNHPSTGNVDISDWLGEIRAHPVPDLPIKQVLTLWSLTQNRFVPLSDGVQVSVTKNDGETDMITFE